MLDLFDRKPVSPTPKPHDPVKPGQTVAPLVDGAQTYEPRPEKPAFPSVKDFEGDAQAAGVHKDTNAIFSENADHDILITDVRHDANDFTTGFASSDPAGWHQANGEGDLVSPAPNMTLLFDPQALMAKASKSGVLRLELIDIEGAFKTKVKGVVL